MMIEVRAAPSHMAMGIIKGARIGTAVPVGVSTCAPIDI